jgi:hypothetical protein
MKNSRNNSTDSEYQNESHIVRKKKADIRTEKVRGIRDIVEMIDDDEVDPYEYARFIK